MEISSILKSFAKDIGNFEIIEDLSLGLKNKVFSIKLKDGTERVLKVFNPENAKYGKFDSELRSLEYFSTLNLSPRVVYQNPEIQVILMTKESTELEDILTSENILELVEKIHESDFQAEFKEGYSEQVLQYGLRNQKDSLAQNVLDLYLHRFRNFAPEFLVPSHGDFRINNLSSRSRKLIPVDWENTLMADVSFDPASMITSLEFEGRPDLAQSLLKKLQDNGSNHNLMLYIGGNYAIYAIYEGIFRGNGQIRDEYLLKSLQMIENG